MPANTYPPKFDKNKTYPAIYNLDKIDVYKEDVNDGYLTVKNLPEFLSFGKHYFTISYNDPTYAERASGQRGQFDRLKEGSSILFEFKDSLGLVIFSDLVESIDDARGNGYVWLKQDPLRTYDEITDGIGTMTIVGELEDVPNEWRGVYNLRTTIPIEIRVGNPNKSLIVFKDPGKMTSGSGGLFISESFTDFNPATTLDDVSLVNISASHLETVSGKVATIDIFFKRSGSNIANNPWQFLGDRILDGNSTTFEDDVNSSYAAGINPNSIEWSNQFFAEHCPSGAPNSNKMKFKLMFKNPDGIYALNPTPYSGSLIDVDQFSLYYPGKDPSNSEYVESDNEWLVFRGTGMRMSITAGGAFAGTDPTVAETFAGQFSFIAGHHSQPAGGGQTFDSSGSQVTTTGPAVEQFPGGYPIL